MAPKKPAAEPAVPVNPEQQAAQQESTRLKTVALDSGLLSDESVKTSQQLGISTALAKCNGFDIVKKPTVRKNRHLVIVNAQLAPAAGGRLGTLSQLDSKNPVMYIDFPSGRLKLHGTLVFPKSKYVVLRIASGHVLCEDVFESMLVFSEAWWVGSKEDNPEEKRLPMPPELATNHQHTGYHFTYGAQPKATSAKLGAGARASQSQQDPEMGTQQQQLSQRSRRASAARVKYAEDASGSSTSDSAGDTQGDDGDDDGGDGTQVGSQVKQRARAAPRRAAAAGKRQYAEASEEDDDSDGSGDDTDGGKPKKTKPAAPAPKRRKKAASTGGADVVLLDSDDGMQGGTQALAKGARAAPKPKPASAGTSRGAIDLVSDSDEEVLAERAKRGGRSGGGGGGAAAAPTAGGGRRTPGRAAGAAAAKKMAAKRARGGGSDDDDDDEDDDGSGDSMSEDSDTEQDGGDSDDDFEVSE